MTPYRILAYVVAALALCALAAGGGATVGTWRAEAACAEATQGLRDEIATLTDRKHALELAIAEQNKGVAVAEAQTQAALAAKDKAQQHAADLAAFSASRMAKLEKAVTEATSCEAVLKNYWELRQ